MCHFVSYIMSFQKIIVYKTPPGGGGEGGGGGSIASSRSISFLKLKMLYCVYSLESPR